MDFGEVAPTQHGTDLKVLLQIKINNTLIKYLSPLLQLLMSPHIKLVPYMLGH